MRKQLPYSLRIGSLFDDLNTYQVAMLTHDEQYHMLRCKVPIRGSGLLLRDDALTVYSRMSLAHKGSLACWIAGPADATQKRSTKP